MPPKTQPKPKGQRRGNRNRRPQELGKSRQKIAVVMAPARKIAAQLPPRGRAAALAKFMMLPRDSRPMRLPVQSTISIKSAVSNFLYRGATVARNTVASADNDEIAFQAWMLTRSPVIPLMELTTVTTSIGTTLWSIQFEPLTNANEHIAFQCTMGVPLGAIGTRAPPPFTDGVTDLPYLMVPNKTSLYFKASGSGTSPLKVTMRYYLTPSFHSPMEFSVTPDASGNANTLIVVSPGWYTIEKIQGTAIGSPAVWTLATCASAATSTIMVASFPPFERTTTPALVYSQCRVNATSVLITNDTPDLYRGGRLVGSRLACNNVSVCDYDALRTAASAAPTAQTFQGDAKQGVYSWTVPDQGSLQYFDYYGNLSGILQPSADLRDFDYINFVYYAGGQISQSGSVGTAIQTFAIECDLTLEYCTNSQVVNVALAVGTPQDMYEAQRLIANRPPFVENPLHWPTLIGLVSRLAKGAYQSARPYIKGAARAVSNQLIENL